MCDAVCSEKSGNPIVVIGNPTFAVTMKGKRATCPKKVVKHLARYFCVVLIDEYNSSKLCPSCESPMVIKTGYKGVRLWQCNSGCLRSDGGGVLVVNKDNSAC